MPVRVRKLPSGKYRVVTLRTDGTVKHVHAEHTTKAKADAQARILRAAERKKG